MMIMRSFNPCFQSLDPDSDVCIAEEALHYYDVIMTTIASQITSLTVVYSTVYSEGRSKKTLKLRVTGLCVGNSPGPVNSPHKGPVTRKMFPFDDVIMWYSRVWKDKLLVYCFHGSSKWATNTIAKSFRLILRLFVGNCGILFENIENKTPLALCNKHGLEWDQNYWAQR